jgi:hypothetical protein
MSEKTPTTRTQRKETSPNNYSKEYKPHHTINLEQFEYHGFYSHLIQVSHPKQSST